MVLILGNDYSLTIILPFALILIMLVFFLTTYIRDNLSKLKLLKKNKKKRESIKVPTNFNKEFLILKRQVSKLTTSNALSAISSLTKKYIGEKLNLTREFSFEELPRDKLQWSIIEFTKRLSDLKYSGKEISKAEIDHLILYLSKILKVKIVQKEKEHFSVLKIPRLPQIILPKFPKINIKILKRKKHHEVIVSKEPKPIKLGTLPKKLTFDLTGLFKRHHKKLEDHEVLEEQKKVISLINKIRHNIYNTDKALKYCDKALKINKILPKHRYSSKLKSLRKEIIKTRDKIAINKELEIKKQITLKKEKQLSKIRGKLLNKIKAAQEDIKNYNKSLLLYKKSFQLAKSLPKDEFKSELNTLYQNIVSTRKKQIILVQQKQEEIIKQKQEKIQKKIRLKKERENAIKQKQLEYQQRIVQLQRDKRQRKLEKQRQILLVQQQEEKRIVQLQREKRQRKLEKQRQILLVQQQKENRIAQKQRDKRQKEVERQKQIFLEQQEESRRIAQKQRDKRQKEIEKQKIIELRNNEIQKRLELKRKIKEREIKQRELERNRRIELKKEIEKEKRRIEHEKQKQIRLEDLEKERKIVLKKKEEERQIRRRELEKQRIIELKQEEKQKQLQIRKRVEEEKLKLEHEKQKQIRLREIEKRKEIQLKKEAELKRIKIEHTTKLKEIKLKQDLREKEIIRKRTIKERILREKEKERRRKLELKKLNEEKQLKLKQELIKKEQEERKREIKLKEEDKLRKLKNHTLELIKLAEQNITNTNKALKYYNKAIKLKRIAPMNEFSQRLDDLHKHMLDTQEKKIKLEQRAKIRAIKEAQETEERKIKLKQEEKIKAEREIQKKIRLEELRKEKQLKLKQETKLRELESKIFKLINYAESNIGDTNKALKYYNEAEELSKPTHRYSSKLKILHQSILDVHDRNLKLKKETEERKIRLIQEGKKRIEEERQRKIKLEKLGEERKIKLMQEEKIKAEKEIQRRAKLKELEKQKQIKVKQGRELMKLESKILKYIRYSEQNLINLKPKGALRYYKMALDLKNSSSIPSRIFNERLKKIHKKIIESQEKPVKIQLPKAEPPKPVNYIGHKKHESLFDRIRVNKEAAKTLALIKKAEKLALKYPLISRKYYNQALIKYYHLPIDKEEEISAKLNRYYDEVNGKHEKELLNIKHTNRKQTEEALKHLKKYRNYVIIENNSLQNNLRRSIYEIKKQIRYQINITQNKQVKAKLEGFFSEIKKKERGVHHLDKKAINHLTDKANSLIKLTSKAEPYESHNTNHSVKKMFSHLKLDHKLPKAPLPQMPKVEKKIKIEPPKEVKIKPAKLIKNRITIEPPKLPERKISERMKKLTEEKEAVYKKLSKLGDQELDRFKQTKRMSTHENIGYRDFLGSSRPKSNIQEHRKIKKLFDAK